MPRSAALIGGSKTKPVTDGAGGSFVRLWWSVLAWLLTALAGAVVFALFVVWLSRS